MAINTYVSIITLNVNGLNASVKRHSLAKQIFIKSKTKKQEPKIYCQQETHFRAKDTHRLKVRGQKEILHANGNDRKVGVTVLISDKIDFKTKAIKKDEEGHYIMIKESVQEEDFTLINIYALLQGDPNT